MTEDGVILVEDTKTKVIVSKVDKDNQAVEGAKLRIADKNGKAADEWTTGKYDHTIEGLVPGEYTLQETAVPSGYKEAAPIAFTLGEDGSVKVNGKAVEKITMIDEKAARTNDVVYTGDTNNVLPFIVIMLLAAGVIVGVIVKKKKEC